MCHNMTCFIMQYVLLLLTGDLKYESVKYK